ncbi:MAG: phosphodiester glycosidase family protein [Kouleothrix sp.]
MLAVAPDGSVAIRRCATSALRSKRAARPGAAVVPNAGVPGGAPAEIEDDGERSRRSALAIDRAGRLLLIAAPGGGFTLRGLAVWLSQSDLAIDRALNLDGGSSTGLYLKDGDLEEAIDYSGRCRSCCWSRRGRVALRRAANIAPGQLRGRRTPNSAL